MSSAKYSRGGMMFRGRGRKLVSTRTKKTDNTTVEAPSKSHTRAAPSNVDDPNRCTLDIDNRESKVLVHVHELSAINYEKKQLTTGDYIVRHDNDILAVLERKSLDDFGASLKDTRMGNTAKLLKLRSMTACRIVYIIECPDEIPPNTPKADLKEYGGIPLKNIRSAIYHLILRDNITIMWTVGTIGTARELVKFVQSAESLLLKTGDTGFLIQSDADTVSLPTAIDLTELTKKQEKSDQEIVREMWSCFRGISYESADDYIKHWSIRDIVTEKIPRSEIIEMRLSSRRKISSIAVNSLCAVGPMLEAKLLACIPGISQKTANDILRGRDLKTTLQAPLAIMCTYQIGKANKQLGKIRAERIISLFTYKNDGLPSQTSADECFDEGHVLVCAQDDHAEHTDHAEHNGQAEHNGHAEHTERITQDTNVANSAKRVKNTRCGKTANIKTTNIKTTNNKTPTTTPDLCKSSDSSCTERISSESVKLNMHAISDLTVHPDSPARECDDDAHATTDEDDSSKTEIPVAKPISRQARMLAASAKAHAMRRVNPK